VTSSCFLMFRKSDVLQSFPRVAGACGGLRPEGPYEVSCLSPRLVDLICSKPPRSPVKIQVNIKPIRAPYPSAQNPTLALKRTWFSVTMRSVTGSHPDAAQDTCSFLENRGLPPQSIDISTLVEGGNKAYGIPFRNSEHPSLLVKAKVFC
jgi:hypothetical protein